MIMDKIKLDSSQQEMITLLEEHHSKSQVMIIAGLIGKKKKLFDSLIELCLIEDNLIPQRASWVLDEVTQRYPNWIDPYVENLSLSLSELKHGGTRRNITKVLSRSTLPIENLGELLNVCFEWLVDKETPIAVRAHCMTIVYRISEIEPEIKGEFESILREFVEIGSAGEKSRARRILKSHG